MSHNQSRLDIRHAVVEAGGHKIRHASRAVNTVVAHDPEKHGQIGIICGQYPSFSRRYRLARMQGKGPYLSPGPYFASIPFRSQCASSIFDNGQPMQICDLLNAFHVRWISEFMNRHNDLCTRSNGCLNPFRINIETARVNVHEYRLSANQLDNVGGSYIRKSGNHRFISRANP